MYNALLGYGVLEAIYEAGVMIQSLLSFLTCVLNLAPVRGREVGGSN